MTHEMRFIGRLENKTGVFICPECGRARLLNPETRQLETVYPGDNDIEHTGCTGGLSFSVTISETMEDWEFWEDCLKWIGGL